MAHIYVALDTETTGTDAARDAIIEIGAVRFGDDGQVLEEWSSLVNPGRAVPFSISQLTGITSQMVAGAPSLADAARPLRHFIGDSSAIIVGHNVDFDLGFLRQGGIHFANPSLDTFELASILLPAQSRYSLDQLAAHFGVAFAQKHRALDDAQATRALFLALVRHAETALPLPIIREINRLAAQSNWPLRAFFQETEQRRSRRAFVAPRPSAAPAAEPDASPAGPLFEAEEEEAEPLRPALSPRPLDEDALAGMLEPDGLFARHFPHFEHRPPQVDMLRAVTQAFNRGQQLLVEAGTGVGKCLTADAILILATGAQVRLGDFIRRTAPLPPILCINRQGRVVYQPVAGVHVNGARPVYELSTSLGRTLVATANHPVLTLRGWVPLCDLSPGDRIATVSSDQTRGLSRREMRAIAQFPDSPALHQLCDSDIYWDRVKKIEPHGEQPTFDLTMEGEPCFVANGIVVHNSIAYLLPAVHYATQNSTRVVISTNTINLQDQLYRKDIPDLRQVLALLDEGNTPPHNLRVALLKGRTNYICMRRLAAMRSRRDLSPDELRVLARILVWLQFSNSGDQTELFLPTARDQAIWLQAAASNESCLPEQCWYARRGRCYFYQARRRAENAHLIVVNHALLLSDVAVENRVLPEYKHLIVDEAHQLETATTHQLSFSSDERHVTRLLDGLHTQADPRSAGLLPDLLARCQQALPAELHAQLAAYVTPRQALVARAQERVVAFFDALHQFVEEQELARDGSTYSQRVRVTSGLRIQPAWSSVEVAWDNAADTLRRLADGLHNLVGGLNELMDYDIPEREEMVQNLADVTLQIREQVTQIGALVSQPSAASIYWLEVAPPERGRHLSLHAAPLHIGPLVEKYLLMPKETVILTSATLRTAGEFDFIQERLHAWEAGTLAVGSPFDYADSTLFYLPTDIPEPNTPGYQRAVEQTLAELISATRGRTLVLFTSYNQLHRTAEAIAPRLADEGITVLEQGSGGSRAQLLESFRSLDKTALLGTRSFWEGIDVMGPALSCLVIARLPFSVPTDPIFAARSESFDEPFYQYSVPETILRFRQGFGRLIRSQSDRGVVVVLDRRLQSKGYGQMFLDSLPECTVRRGPLASLPQAAARWIEG